MNESISLAFKDGSSDKVYHLVLGRDGDTDGETFSVVAQYGRRGSALTSQTKADHTTYEKAKKAFDKVKREKIAKGYVEEGQAPAPQVAPSGIAVDVKQPELLEEITNGEHLRYITDPCYWMQDKSDGVSRGVIKQGGEIFGINKRGLPVPLPAELVAELSRIQLDAFQIDAELVGQRLICRDLLIFGPRDISDWPYEDRFNALAGLLWALGLVKVVVVETWRDAEKGFAIARQRAERREGVVFKLRSAPYRPGRNGQHKKYKFIKTLSAIAGKPGGTGKESVDLFLVNPDWDGVETFGGQPIADVRGTQGKLIRCGTVSLIGKPAVKEGDVVEVAYLYAQPSRLLSQARLLHVRTDVAAEECTTAQLIFKREEES